MLRLVVVLLLLANGAYFAWAQGHLLRWGMGPTQQSEPHRLTQQIRPEALRIAGGDEARRIETATLASAEPRPPECLATGPLDEPAAAALRTALEGWPAGSWSLEPAVEPGRWIVYMGKYLTAENLSRKRAELRQRGVAFEALANPSLEPGLSLGGFATSAAANQHLETVVERGVRTARVVLERPEVRGPALRLPQVDDTLRPRLDELRPALAGRALRPCR